MLLWTLKVVIYYANDCAFCLEDSCYLAEYVSLIFNIFALLIIQISHVWEFIEVKEVITPFGRSGS